MKPTVPTDISITATPAQNRKVKGNLYITLRRCSPTSGEDKLSFYWTWKGEGSPTVADVLGGLIEQVRTVIGFTRAPEWVVANYDKDYRANHLPELVTEFTARKRIERRLRRFLGPDLYKALGES